MKSYLVLFGVLMCTALQLDAQTLSNYQSVVLSQSPAHCFKLDNSLMDSVVGSIALDSAGGRFTSDSFGGPNTCRAFTAAADSLSTTNDVVAGGTGSAVGSLSLLFRYLDATNNSGQRFLFTQNLTTTNANAFALFLENDNPEKPNRSSLMLRAGNKAVSILPVASLVPTNWYYFAVTYDEKRNSAELHWYVGRLGDTLNTGTMDINNEAVVGDNGTLIIGSNATGKGAYRNPGSGRIDEVALWNRELSAAEVNAQFTAALPAKAP